MLKRIFFVRPLIVSIFLFFFIIDVRATEEEVLMKEKQAFLRENILEKGYNADDFMGFLERIKGEAGQDLNNWTMQELQQVVEEFQKENELKEKNKKKNENNIFEEVNNNISPINDKYNNEIKAKDNNSGKNITEQNNQGNLFGKGQNSFVPDPNNIINDQSSLTNSFYDLSHNKIARRVFDFYRYGGKFLTSFMWSVVNSYCGFEEIIMNDWYCFKYAMCSGYRLQPKFMGSRVWIDMNFNFLEGIAGFLIRFFLFNPSYKIQENIFDFFNVCIDVKVYNNLYFAVNVVGIVRSIVLLFIHNDSEKNQEENKDKIVNE